MEDKNTIAYKQWLENLNEPAPEGAWEYIADQLDIDQAWEGISESLDIDDVWNQVEQNLPHSIPAANTTPTRLPKVFWAAALLALFTLTTPVTDQVVHQPIEKYQSGTALADDKSLQHTEQGQVINSEKDLREPVVTKKPQVEVQEKASILVAPTQAIAKQKATPRKSGEPTANHPASKPSATQPISVGEETLLKEQALVSPVPFLNEQTVLPISENLNAVSGLVKLISSDSVEKAVKIDSTERLAVLKEQTDSVRQEKPGRSSRWQVGLIGAVKNTWLINPETSNGLKRESLTNTKVTWGKEFGVLAQRSIGRKSFIQAEYYFYSEIGQRYQQYIDALYQTKDIKLKYQKLQLVYRTRIFETRKLPPLYVAAGFHASKLSVASTSIGGEGQVVTEQYMPWDYGVLAGLESEFFLTDKIILVPGIRASYGMRNIYGGSSQSPANLNKTNTATLGFSLALKYSFH